MTRAHHDGSVDVSVHVFPPALAPVLRNRAASMGRCLSEVADDQLVQLLTTVFWAGLETYEGEVNPIGVAFVGDSAVDFVISEGGVTDAAPLYQWKILRFDRPRPFAIPELVKLAVAGVDRRIYSAVGIAPDGRLEIVGLAREGFNVDADPFVKIVASRPGCLSIRSGRELLLAYERGAILTGGEDVVFAAGPVRRGLEAIARMAGVDEDVVADYVEAVRSLVREMAAHGHGGILVISREEHPNIGAEATYRMTMDSSLAAHLRLARRLGRARTGAEASASGRENPSFVRLLRNAFLTEVERGIEEVGALTAIDGAVVLNRDLALVAFGVVLPVAGTVAVAEAIDGAGKDHRIVDLGSRGARHRASGSYAQAHPGSVVFVASEDGQVSCMLHDSSQQHALLWRLGPAAVRPA